MIRLAALLLLAFLTACSPLVQERTPLPQTHEQLVHELFDEVEDEDGLPYRNWLAGKRPRAVIIALHGMNDYSRAFEGSGIFFSDHNIMMLAYDQRGFGRGANVGVWPGERNMVGDLRQYVEAVKAFYPNTPVYILGESMGGAVTIAALAKADFPKVDGIILAAPAVWGNETMNPIFRGTLWLAAHTFPFRKITGRDLKIIASNNFPMLRALYYDPLIIKSTRVDAIYGMVRLMDSAYVKIPKVHVPVLMLYGGMDQIIPPHAISRALHRFTVPVTFAYYPDGYHMLLRDFQGERVMKDILSWIRDPNKKLPSGYGHYRLPDGNSG